MNYTLNEFIEFFLDFKMILSSSEASADNINLM